MNLEIIQMMYMGNYMVPFSRFLMITRQFETLSSYVCCKGGNLLTLNPTNLLYCGLRKLNCKEEVRCSKLSRIVGIEIFHNSQGRHNSSVKFGSKLKYYKIWMKNWVCTITNGYASHDYGRETTVLGNRRKLLACCTT